MSLHFHCSTGIVRRSPCRCKGIPRRARLPPQQGSEARFCRSSSGPSQEKSFDRRPCFQLGCAGPRRVAPPCNRQHFGLGPAARRMILNGMAAVLFSWPPSARTKRLRLGQALHASDDDRLLPRDSTSVSRKRCSGPGVRSTLGHRKMAGRFFFVKRIPSRRPVRNHYAPPCSPQQAPQEGGVRF
jgi:hypothetical protein